MISSKPTLLRRDEGGNLLLDFSGGVHPEPYKFDYYPDKPGLLDKWFVSIDFETFYTSTYSLLRMSPWAYVFADCFDAHTVSICLFNPKRNKWRVWVGHPSLAPWREISKYHAVSHNAPFDELVHYRLRLLGVIPMDCVHPSWSCTLDMGAYLQVGRSLHDVSLNLLGIDLDKSIRDKMKGGGATTHEIYQYAAKDAIACALLWSLFSHLWPSTEDELSQMTRYSGWAGVHVDVAGCHRDIRLLELRMLEIQRQLPWGFKGKATSMNEVKKQCSIEGIYAPPSLSMDDLQTVAWCNKFAAKYPWVELIRDFTKCRQISGSLRMLLERLRADGTVPFSLKYAGTPTTLRWASGEKLRMHNLDKDPHHGVHVRHKFTAGRSNEEDCVFLIADSSQIEPRVLNWLVGDTVFLESCAKGQSPYEAHARSAMGYTNPLALKKADPTQYQMAKARVLALGYQAWVPKFVEMARTMCGIEVRENEPVMLANIDKKFISISIDEYDAGVAEGRLNPADWSWVPSGLETVLDYRERSPLIVDYWKSNEEDMRRNVGRDHFVELPNGSFIRYWNVRLGSGRHGRDESMVADMIRNTKNPDYTRDFYGGKLVENKVQRVSREVLAHFLLLCKRHGIPNIWHVHDELICRVPRRQADEKLKVLLQIMHTPPTWATGLPVAAEGGIHEYYTKD